VGFDQYGTLLIRIYLWDMTHYMSPMYLDWDHRVGKTIRVIHTSGEDARDAFNCRSLSVKEPLNIGKYRVLLRKETSKDKET